MSPATLIAASMLAGSTFTYSNASWAGLPGRRYVRYQKPPLSKQARQRRAKNKQARKSRSRNRKP